MIYIKIQLPGLFLVEDRVLVAMMIEIIRINPIMSIAGENQKRKRAQQVRHIGTHVQ